MKRLLPQHSVRVRLLLLAVGVELVMLTLLIGNSLRLLHDAMTDQARWQVRQMMPVLNAALKAPLAQRDFATLQAVLDESRATEGIDYVVVTDREGRVLVSSGWKQETKLPEPSRKLPLFSFSTLQRYDEILPIEQSGQQLGLLHLGLDLTHIASARRVMVIQNIGIALAALVFSALIMALIGYWLTRHLSALTAASLQVAAGNLSPPTLHEGDDDIGQLGVAFNTMSRAIAERVGELTRAKEAAEASERAKSASEKRLSSITDSTQDAIIMMDNRGCVSFWNPAAERTLGYRSGEAIGRDLHDLLAPERFLEAHRAAFPVFSRTGQGAAVGKTLELAARRKDGQEITVALSLSAVSLFGEWHAVGILRDITEKKRVEEDLLETNRQLEEATARANAMALQAQTASVAKSEFLANMSHEIRTPINGVIGMTGLLLDTELNEEQRRYAQIVEESAKSLLGIINDVLDFSKIEAGKLELEILDFDLSSLLDDFAATLAVRAHEKGLEFYCGMAGDVPAFLRGDPGRLRQTLTNLTGNAIKFTQQGEVTVTVTVAGDEATEGREDDNTVLLLFSVRDTGVGIPEDKLGPLFDKFTQVDASTTRRYGGTGLGLAISQQLAGLMGGRIGVKSEEGRGSEFWFTARFERQPQGARAEAPEQSDLRDVRVLVVDDNGTSRQILVTALASWGMLPAEASNGSEALGILYRALEAGAPYRAAIIDMQMPGMDGAALGRAIQADPGLAGIRMVMLTSLGTRGDARRYEEIGFAGYLTKPLQRRELRDVLSLALAEPTEPGLRSRPIATRHRARESLPRFDGRKARILLAEDNITNQQVALGTLRKLGLGADAVADGQEAVKALEIMPYDLVLMDCQMPVMDGYEATRLIRDPRSAVRNHSIPIIAMTAHAMTGDREKCLDAGMNDYLAKPVSPLALAETLDKWLPKQKGEGAGSAVKEERGAEASRDGEPGEPVAWDRTAMLERLMGDEELAQTIVEAFVDDMPRQIESLKVAVAAGDVDGTRRIAHTIKGAAANMGGERLRAKAFEMEKAAPGGDLDVLRGFAEELEGQFDDLRKAMTEGLAAAGSESESP